MLLTVNFASPDASVVPVPFTRAMVETPSPWVSVTALSLTGFSFASLSVTVIVEVASPLAATLGSLAVTVDLPADTAPAVNVTSGFCVIVTPPLAAV